MIDTTAPPATAVSFRPLAAGDLEFLYRLYASTREEELAPVPWSDEQKESFLRFQFDAQHRYYQEHFPDADYLVIERRERPIGRLYLDRRPDEHRLIDIALVPGSRGAGIGGAILRDLQEEAGAAGKPLRIHVERNNPALRLYARLGFEPLEEQGIYYLMEWRPS